MRKKFIVGNWKMNLSLKEAVQLADTIKTETKNISNIDVGICPPSVFLSEVHKTIDGSSIILGAQNIHDKENGAFTGEVAGCMIKDVGCTHAIIGHSERRHVFGETDCFINEKLKTCFSVQLTPIFCVGEKLEDRESGKTNDVVGSQLLNGLKDITSENAEKLVVAYEPVWAIGTGKTATPEQANEVHKFIRKCLSGKFGEKLAAEIVIQYGGSVKPDNAKELLLQSDIDGALVGGASLDAVSFLKMIEIADNL
ncbi:MAG: triose-phosphate isomerase [Candidatus Anammoxibacter sp.]